MTRAGGSIGIAGISRTCNLMGHHPDYHPEERRRVLVNFANNFGADGRALDYRLEAAAIEGFGELVIRLSQIGETQISPRRLLTGGKPEE